MNSRFRSVAALAITLSVIAFFLGCTRKNDQEVLIGHLGALSGSEATFGVNTQKGIQMAVEEWNAKGGIKGKKIVVKSLDNQGKPEEAASTATRLINQDHVLALIGDNTSSRALAAAPIAQQNKIPLISSTATTPKLTQVGDSIFRICFIDPFQGQVMAKFATENLKVRRVAILRDHNSDFTSDSSYRSGDFDFKDFPAVTGKITIGANRNAVKSAVVVKVDGAMNRNVTTIPP